MDEDVIPFLPAWRMWAAAQPEDGIRAHMAAVLQELENAWLRIDLPEQDAHVDAALVEYGELRRVVIERWRGE